MIKHVTEFLTPCKELVQLEEGESYWWKSSLADLVKSKLTTNVINSLWHLQEDISLC